MSLAVDAEIHSRVDCGESSVNLFGHPQRLEAGRATTAGTLLRVGLVAEEAGHLGPVELVPEVHLRGLSCRAVVAVSTDVRHGRLLELANHPSRTFQWRTAGLKQVPVAPVVVEEVNELALETALKHLELFLIVLTQKLHCNLLRCHILRRRVDVVIRWCCISKNCWWRGVRQ